MKLSSTTLGTLILSLMSCLSAFAAPPTAPQNVQQAWVNGLETLLLWDDVPGATSYNVYRADDTNISWNLVAAGLTVPRHRDWSVQFLPSYYAVTALNAEGESAGSEAAVVTGTGMPFSIVHETPSVWNGRLTQTNAVVGWASSRVNGDQGLLEWGLAEPDATNFTFAYFNTNYSLFHGFELSNLTPATVYNYRITSINEDRYAASITSSFTTPDTNRAPVIHYQLYHSGEPRGINFWLTDADEPPQSLTFSITQPTNGVLSGPWETWNSEIGNHWFLTYERAPGARGLDAVIIHATDGLLESTSTITISNWSNRLPEAGWTTTNIWEDTPTEVALPNYDADGDPLSFEILDTWNGTVSGTAPNLTFTPFPDVTGFASILYVVSDGFESNWGYLEIAIQPVNDKPVVYPVSISTYEDYPTWLYFDFTDREGGEFHLSIVRGPTNGVLVGSEFYQNYFPAPNFHGTDSIEFVVHEPDGTTSDPAILTIEVISLNDSPTVPAGPLIEASESTPVAFTLTATDIENDVLEYGIFSGPYQGTLSGTPPNLVYTPDPGFIGTDSFTYYVFDGMDNGWGSASISVGLNNTPRVEGLRRRIDNNGAVQLWWNAVPGAQLYRIYRAATNGVSTLIADNIASTNFSDAMAEYHQTYSYIVRTWDGLTEGAPSNPVFARRDETGMITINEQNWVLGITTAQVQFCSSLISGVDGLWEFGTTTNYDRTLENTNLLGCQTFFLNDLTAETLYYYRLTATDSNGNAVTLSGSFATASFPVANPQSIETIEDSSVLIELSGIDPNSPALPLSFVVTTAPAHGSLIALGPSTYRYTPDSNYFGSDSFVFVARTSEAESAPATISLNVVSQNDRPVAMGGQLTIAEDTDKIIVLSGSDPEGSALAYEVLTLPSHGTLQPLGTNLIYRPDTNYFGADSFTFRVSDGQDASESATVLINITNVNDAPVALAQAFTISEDTLQIVFPVGSDPDGDPVSWAIAGYPAHGYLVNLTATNITYAPYGNYNGIDSFRLYLSDGKLNSEAATVSITITPMNDAPFASDIHGGAFEDTPTPVRFVHYDLEGDPVTYTVLTFPTHGTLTGSNQNWVYLPSTNYTGPDSFTYKANDGMADSTPATVSFIVFNLNDAPIPNSQSVTTPENAGVSVTLDAFDVEGSPLTYSILSSPTNGVLAGTNQSYVYSPAPWFNGADSFSFSVSDGTLVATGQIHIVVTPVNQAPVANAASVTVGEDLPVNLALTATDRDADPLTFRIVVPPAHGILSGNGAALVYTPAANYHGPDAFSFVANDGSIDSTPAEVSVVVNPDNDVPSAHSQSVSVGYNTSKAITLAGSDVEEAALTYAVTSAPTNGTLSGAAPNLIYTPATGSAGGDQFAFTVHDGTNTSAAATVSITTQPPTATPAAPTALTVTVPTALGTLVLDWTDNSSNEDGFKIERSANGTSGWTQIATVGINVRSFTNTGLAKNTRYYYRVRGFNRLGNSAYSNVANGRAR